ncbi:Phospholipase A1-IIgamma [Forsythia ovata]|uniref:Phospholipase A1 n=1 Tax=Forsythia ovata TaxID=205694 RepID=A0ABD1X1F2_9LAMI
MQGISHRWRLLSGQENWKNLLDPLDIDVRRYIIHYGAMAQATYDTFNSEKLSRYAGSSRYARRHLLARVGLEKGNIFKYEIVKYIYATSSISVPNAFIMKPLASEAWCKESNWMGYVGVSTDEGKVALGRRDILIAWRGTVQAIEWVKDFDFPLVPASKILGKLTHGANVHSGVLSIYTSTDKQSKYNKTSARDQVLLEVRQQVERFKNEEMSITITGHSLGAALSTLCAADIVANGYNKPGDKPNDPCPVTVFKFGSPLVGDLKFKEILESMKKLHILNVRNAADIVPHYPPVGYAKIGIELLVDSRISPFLKYPGDVITWHILEPAYLHSVAGTKGSEGGFHLEVNRDIALVNKSSDALKDKYSVPSFWWCQQNKGMVQEDNGHWVLHDHENDDN